MKSLINLYSTAFLLLLGTGMTLNACGEFTGAEFTDAGSIDASIGRAAPLVAAVEVPEYVAEVRQAVSRALPYLEQEGVAWMDKHHCLS